AQVWLLGALAAASFALWAAHAPREAHAASPSARVSAQPLPIGRRPDGTWLARTRPLRIVRPSMPAPHLVAYVHRSVALRSRPFGPVLAQLGARTPFGSPQALSVVRSRGGGRWLAVPTPELGNRA